MNKQEAINFLINNIYSNNTDLILTTKEIKNIEKFYKENLITDEDFESYIKNFPKLKKLKSGTFELKKQFEQKKALQPAILSECNYIETLAKLFDLKKCVDLDTRPINSIPVECAKFIKSGKLTYSCARYLYYNPNNNNIFIFQYGNPAAGDAEIIINENNIRLEFKEKNAKAGEYDITGLYDEEGTLKISTSFKENTPELVPLIERFNKETNIIEQLGHNYNSFDEQTKINSIHDYFFKHNIDILITSTKEDTLIALTPECLDIELPDGRRFITTENSEIRTSGRNYTKVFTPKLLDNTLEMLNAIKLENNNYKINLNQKNIEIVKARGKNKTSRIKLRNIFFVSINKVKIDNGFVIFSKEDVRQLKPSISMHIKVNATKDMLKEYFQNPK